ncbi:hypothetical protein LMG6001_02783 [Achromobacter insolitus]|uniref:Uncharacterized protein n=1 Tax=Achromobacter insolitus TaxID=217204 RepID=A0A6S7F9H8_9BURK|nr:hypothetical protein [Achromobacter insolitus]CAB3934488.1 hypothetical protein LMG6000_03722 [Achromobacter insolitus]CAB3936345.1 hypothetical protein LMG5997_02634 [Achromobacter insolitus]CAB3951458.1 hypothetical protein LMG6001_02783 [Achromobacter insolitus]
MSNCLGSEGYQYADKVKTEAIDFAARIRKTAAERVTVDNSARAVSSYLEQQGIASRTLEISE